MFSGINPSKQKALFLAKRQLVELVCDAVNLEGINYTLPEVQTLLDGITVGGHKITDEIITLNQADAWKALFHSIEADTFALTKPYACMLHDIAGKEEALKWGQFRDGLVTIAGTDYTPPVAESLDEEWEKMLLLIQKIEDRYDQAITVFLYMARTQFFFDVNKRMGRFMMNGLLLSQGYPVINLPAKRQLEFNQLMLDFYASGQMQPMISFMKSCMDERVIKMMSD